MNTPSKRKHAGDFVRRGVDAVVDLEGDVDTAIPEAIGRVRKARSDGHALTNETFVRWLEGE